jgi:hypothetical protein
MISVSVNKVIKTVENVNEITPAITESDSNVNKTLIPTFPYNIVVSRKFESRRICKTLLAPAMLLRLSQVLIVLS